MFTRDPPTKLRRGQYIPLSVELRMVDLAGLLDIQLLESPFDELAQLLIVNRHDVVS